MATACRLHSEYVTSTIYEVNFIFCHCGITAERLRDNCGSTAWQLRFNCGSTAWHLHVNCLTLGDFATSAGQVIFLSFLAFSRVSHTNVSVLPAVLQVLVQEVEECRLVVLRGVHRAQRVSLARVYLWGKRLFLYKADSALRSS